MTEPVTTVLREALHEEAAKLPGGDPWPRFAAREATHRRARRARATVAAGVLALVVGVQTNVVPLPGWVPGIAIAASPSPLAHGPARGGLAGDTAWQAGLRGAVQDVQDPEGWWQVTDRDAIKVIYAGDVPGRRLALVLVPLHLGVIRDWQLQWYDGPVGAAPDRMRFWSGTTPDSPVESWMDGSATGGGTALVIGPPGATVTVDGGVTYTSAGTLERRRLVTTTGSGIAVLTLPPSAEPPVLATRVTVDGGLYHEGPVEGSWSGRGAAPGQDATPEQLAAAVQDARGPALDPAVFAVFVQSALRDSHLAARDVTLRLLWSGTVNGSPAGLLTVQPAGGGVIAYAMHGTAMSWRTDLRLLLPAAGAFERPLAWRMRAEGGDGRTDQVIVVAPPGTTALTVTAGAAAPVPVPLDAAGAGGATVPPQHPATVTATVGPQRVSTPVPLLESDGGNLPGATPGTRITG